MPKRTNVAIITGVILLIFCACSSNKQAYVVDDNGGVLNQTEAFSQNTVEQGSDDDPEEIKDGGGVFNQTEVISQSPVKQYPDDEPEELLVKYSEQYNLTLLLNDNTGIEYPAGILCRSDDIIVCDRTGNRLVLLDYDGNQIKTVGKLGFGELEFVEPTGIATWNDDVYVLDAGNSRIQVLNKDLEFERWISLEPLAYHALNDRYISIAVNSAGDIYVSTDSVGEVNSFIYIIRDDAVVGHTSSAVGYVASTDSKIYASNVYEIFIEGNQTEGRLANHFLYEIQDDNLVELFRFPFKYGTADFLVSDGFVYVISPAWLRLDKFTLNGEYVETLASFYDNTKSLDIQQASIHMHISLDANGNFFITNKQSNVIYKIAKK